MDALDKIKANQNNMKGLPAPGGWVFLINDTNDFLSWQFGTKAWTFEQSDTVKRIIDERVSALSGRVYQMVISPEKSVIYSEWLPESLSNIPSDPHRPAMTMARNNPNSVYYLAERFNFLKRFGLLYYRGDTHVNWLGAYHLYRETILLLANKGARVGAPFNFSDLQHYVAGWEGDVFIQVPEELQPEFEVDASLGRVGAMLEVLLSHTLPDAKKRAKRIPTPDGYIPGGGGRETIIMEHSDKTLPTALVFRDSTATLSLDMLAEHFSRTVFVWHDGDVIGELIDRENPDIVLHLVAERFLATYPSSTPINRNLV